MQATDLAKAAIRAWESKDVGGLASLLSDDFVCRGLLPQPIQKVHYPAHRHKNFIAVQAPGILCQREDHHDDHGRFLT